MFIYVTFVLSILIVVQALKTLFNIVEDRMLLFFTLMSVLYNDVQKGKKTARNAKV